MQKQKNTTLNMLKGIACFAVVMLHCGFPGIVGKVIYGISRFAVPLFFAVSGYFVYNEQLEKTIARLPKKITHIISLFIGTEIIYFIWHIVQHSISRGGIEGGVSWISSWFTFENVFNFVLFQTTVIGDVSWFLVALILCYVVTFLIARKNLWRTSFILIPVLLIMNVIIGEIFPFAGISTQWYWCSNFWLLGFSCYALGYCIKINEDKLKNILTDKKIFIILIVSVILNLVERVGTSASQFLISNIPFMVCCFIYCLKYPEKYQSSKPTTALSKLGEFFSFGVYILHPIVRDVLKMIAEQFGWSQIAIWNWLRPVLVFVFSIMIYGVWAKGVKKCRSKTT